MLEVKNISMNIDGTQILTDISFSVYSGEFLSILGPSGCGKTTLLKILGGLLRPTGGSIVRGGKDITALTPAERRIGIVFQDYALFENMTTLNNVAFALKIHKETRADAVRIAEEMLDKLDMLAYRDRYPIELSGGQQQRLAIARTLAVNPDMILFDESLSALDVETRIAMRGTLKRVQEQFHTTMLFITHDQEDAFVLSDRIMVMETSRIVQIDTPENILRAPANDYVKSFVVDTLENKIRSLSRFALAGETR